MGRAARASDPVSVKRRERIDAWHKAVSDQCVAEILRYRDLRGFSNDELRRRLAALGWDLTRDSLAGILSAKRKSMPAADLLLFAMALNVPPFALLFPVWTNDQTQRWPDDTRPLDGQTAALWAGGRFGDTPAPTELLSSELLDDYYEVADILDLRMQLQAQLREVKMTNAAYRLEPNTANAEALESAIVALFDAWSSLRLRYRSAGRPTLESGFDFLESRELVMPPFPLDNIYSDQEEAWYLQMEESRRARRAARNESAGDG